LVSIDLSAENGEEIVAETLDKIRNWLDENHPAGVNTFVTGEAAIVTGIVDAGVDTMETTLLVTLVLVVLLLLLIYRSPISPLVPLIAVSISYLITRGIVALLAQDLLEVSTYADILLVVVIFGAGTDYCLFLISRFREEMVGQTDGDAPATTMVARVGETISSSAGTVFVGFMAMVFAEFGVLNTSGPTLAIGIIVSLISGLTFVPAVLSLLGQRAFWPGRATHRSSGRFYATISRIVSTRPIVTIVVIVVIMAPLALKGLMVTLNYDVLGDLPDDMEAKQGFTVMEEALGPGNLSPLTVVVTNRNPVTMATEMVQLEQDLGALDGIAQVASVNNPMGPNGEMGHLLRVDVQLGMLMQILSAQPADAATLAGVADYLDLVTARFPEAADDPNLEMLQSLLAEPDTFAENQGEFMGAMQGLMGRFATIDAPYVMITALTNSVPAAGAMLGQLLANFVTADGTGYQMTLLLADDPNSNTALDTVVDVRDVLARYENGGSAVVSGQPAVYTDMREIINTDLLLTIGIVLAGIFLVLVLMLRSVVVPLYLAGSVVLSYLFTLGLTELVFSAFMDTEGVPFILPIFSFVFLVALGVDYCIFLIGRVKEEVAYHGIHQGVQNAIESTGAIITSAGIILAGTFGSMLVGEILMLKELGFAVAVGVIVETVVVCTLFVPATTIVLGKLAWWPGGVPQKTHQAQHTPVPAPGD
jgi:RND superfamily putative drug exporter